MKQKLKWSLVPFAFVLLVAFCTPPRKEFSGNIFGTFYSVKIADEVSDIQKVERQVQTELKRIDLVFSTYKPQSVLSRFNRAPVHKWVKVDSEFLNLVKTSLEIQIETGGAFDITLGDLVNAWGFGPGGGNSISRRSFRKKAQHSHSPLAFSPGSLKKNRKFSLDMSAIAKGYAVDSVSDLLKKQGYQNYLVEIGGEIRASGTSGEQKWRIGVEDPAFGLAQGKIKKVVALRDISMATSGDYRNFYIENKKKYSHTMNPGRNAPVENSMASVSVIHKQCSIADAYATDIMVMGAEKGYQWALKNKLPVLIMYRENKTLKEKISPAFKSYIAY